MNWKHILYIIPLSLMTGIILGAFMMEASETDFEKYVAGYCRENYFVKYNPLDVNLNLAFTQLQDHKWYWCTRLGDSYQTYAFNVNNSRGNYSYGTHIHIE